MTVRPPAVAGLFYPGEARALAVAVDGLLANAERHTERTPKAVIVPHAGYMYSGPIAASAYATLAPRAAEITRVILLGPAHRSPLDGIALPTVDAFRTPLGDIPIDNDGRDAVRELPGVVLDDRPHESEHSLEVQLPFLQRTLDHFTLVPMVVGHPPATLIANVVDRLWGGGETVFVVSSDLSHYEDHLSASRHDRVTAAAIIDGLGDAIGPYDACGAYPVRGLLAAARDHGLTPTMLDLRTSGDTAGPRDRVVGYGAFSFAAPV
jgi:AmmeMemoRadiSam system protein B